MAEDREEWPDREYERREQDSSLPTRVVLDILHWWRKRAGLVAKTATVLGFVATLLVGTFSTGAGWAVIAGQWEGIPNRVSALETWRHDSVPVAADTAFRRLDRLSARVDTQRAELERLRSNYTDLAATLDRLEQLSESNHCWIRVTAGEESRFNCSAGVEP